MRIKSVSASFKAGPDDGLAEGEFVVYPSTFVREPDSYGDVVAKGAFEDTIKEWAESGNVLPGLYGHRLDDPDFFVASANEMIEDDHGWRIKGAFDLESPKGKQVYRLVKGRRLNQLSFAFDVLEEGKVELEDGRKVNELRKLKVYEFSFVPIGANQDTSVVAVKAIAESLKAGRVLSAKNEGQLREARDAIDSVLASLGDDDAAKSARSGGNDDQEKASGPEPAKSDEEPRGAKSDEEPMPSTPVKRLAAQAHLYARMGQEGA